MNGKLQANLIAKLPGNIFYGVIIKEFLNIEDIARLQVSVNKDTTILVKSELY